MRLFLLTIAGALLVSLSSTAQSQQAEPLASVEQWVVVMHDPRSPRRRSRVGGVQYSPGSSYASDPQLDRAARRLSRDFNIDLVDQWPIKALTVHCVVVRLREGADVAETLRALRADERVSSVQPMYRFATESTVDPYRRLQPALEEMQVATAHSVATGRGVSISVIDSGVDAKHPDLQDAIALVEDFVDGDKADDAEQHGTGIAGIIAATTDNGIGVSGIAPDVSIQALRACWQDAEASSKAHCNTLTLSRALDRAIELEPSILNLSLSGPADPLLEQLLAILLQKGTLVVAAFDESRNVGDRFPTRQPGVIFALTSDKDRSGVIDPDCFPAPGTDVLTVQPDASYGVLTGHSMSAAHISGVAALLLEAQPEIGSIGVADALQRSLRPSQPSSETEAANGRLSVSACRALFAVGQTIDCDESS